MIRLLLALLIVGCASTPPRLAMPTMPAPVDLEHLIPKPPAPLVVPAGVPRFDDTPVDPNQCPGLPAGILVDEATYAASIACRSERSRLAVEVAAMHRVRSVELGAWRDVDAAYRMRLAVIERERARAEAWRPWIAAGGAVVGLALGGLLGALVAR